MSKNKKQVIAITLFTALALSSKDATANSSLSSTQLQEKTAQLLRSKELDKAQANWTEDVPFESQVRYQVEFRNQTDYLATDATHLGKVLLEKPENMGIQQLHLYLTDAEAMEFTRRQKLGDKISEIAELVGAKPSEKEGEDETFSPNFAGVWQDQKDGGAIVVAVVDTNLISSAKIKKIAGGEQNVRIIQVKYSWNDIEKMRSQIADELIRASVRAEIRINSTRSGRRLEIITPDPKELDEMGVLEFLDTKIIDITKGELDREEGLPTTVHSEANQMPGLSYDPDPGGNCMWGSNGHTSNRNYLITAGHCSSPPFENFSGWTNVMELHQANVFHLTPGSVYVRSIHNSSYDIKRVGSPQADSNCYHLGSDNCTSFISRRALHNSWEVGADVVCTQLQDRVACGFVTEENVTSQGCNQRRMVRYAIDTSSGDSGTGIIGPFSGNSYSIDAIHTCGSGTTGLGGTAYDAKDELDFDFNCASFAARNRIHSFWGTCPTVNR